jgi:hypothetical protein
MMTDRLRSEADAIAARGRVSFADVRRLQRDLLPDGVSSRDEAEILISLDHAVSRADRSWTDFFVTSLVDFVVWAERPTGIVNEEAATWLSDRLDSDTMTPRGRALIRAIVAEAERVHERLAEHGEDEAAEIVVTVDAASPVAAAA